jgi:hypothetical protein
MPDKYRVKFRLRDCPPDTEFVVVLFRATVEDFPKPQVLPYNRDRSVLCTRDASKKLLRMMGG